MINEKCNKSLNNKYIEIPEGTTYGDVIKSMFSNFEIDDRLGDTVILETHYPHPYCRMQFSREVWNSPYRKEQE